METTQENLVKKIAEKLQGEQGNSWYNLLSTVITENEKMVHQITIGTLDPEIALEKMKAKNPSYENYTLVRMEWLCKELKRTPETMTIVFKSLLELGMDHLNFSHDKISKEEFRINLLARLKTLGYAPVPKDIAVYLITGEFLNLPKYIRVFTEEPLFSKKPYIFDTYFSVNSGNSLGDTCACVVHKSSPMDYKKLWALRVIQ